MPILIYEILLLGFAAWFNIMLLRGKNLARMAFIALLFLLAPAIFVAWADESGAEVALNMVSIILSLWLVRMMFTEPIKGLFVRRRPSKPVAPNTRGGADALNRPLLRRSHLWRGSPPLRHWPSI